MNTRTLTTHRQNGTTLVEALIALLIMAIGMLAAVGLLGQLRATGEQAKQRVAAGRIALDELARQRSAAVAIAAGGAASTPMGEATRRIDAAETRFTVNRTDATYGRHARQVTLQVQWEDRQRGGADAPALTVHSLIAETDPGLLAALATGPADGLGLLAAHQRHPSIPLESQPLDERESAFKPVESGLDVWVFSHSTGRIDRMCRSSKSTAALTTADLADCPHLPVQALVVRGYVQTSLESPPSAASATDSAPPFGVMISLTSSPHLVPPVCLVDLVRPKTRGHRGAEYLCAVVPRSPTARDPTVYWSGRTELTGLPLGEGGVRVCRFSRDQNRNGAIDNQEHPDHYTKVNRALLQQNFLLVRYEARCPGGDALEAAALRLRDDSTVPHQP